MQYAAVFLVIKNRETLRKLSEAGKKATIPLFEHLKDASPMAKDFYVFLKTKSTDLFYGAPVLVIILGNKTVMTSDWNCAMAAQNMMLAAHAKGIGSCWIGGALPALMDEGLLKGLGAPEGYKAVVPVIFGYPKGKTETPGRSEPLVKWIN